MNDATYLGPREMAAALGISIATFQRWRTAGVFGVRLPVERTLGARVFFTLAGIQRWQAEVDAARAARRTPPPAKRRDEQRRRKAATERATAELRQRERLRKLGVL